VVSSAAVNQSIAASVPIAPDRCKPFVLILYAATSKRRHCYAALQIITPAQAATALTTVSRACRGRLFAIIVQLPLIRMPQRNREIGNLAAFLFRRARGLASI